MHNAYDILHNAYDLLHNAYEIYSIVEIWF